MLIKIGLAEAAVYVVALVMVAMISAVLSIEVYHDGRVAWAVLYALFATFWAYRAGCLLLKTRPPKNTSGNKEN